MTLDDKTLDHLESQIPEMAAVAFRQAYWKSLEEGHSVLVADEGGLYEVFPDGRREFRKPLEPRIPVANGSKVAAR
jgi:hypothetical protein